MAHTKYVVIGGGVAGMACVEKLRELIEANDEITLICSSGVMKHLVNVVQLTKSLETFDVQEISLDTYRKTEEGLCENVKLLQTTVKKLDTKDKKVIVEDGDEHVYDIMCICSGARPKLIAEHHPNVIGLRDVESVQACEYLVNNEEYK
jgi:pyridine nucleotide-disulfide oxidoreductase domain-containing protein 1